ncbi:MAG: substrate-binding domain-containing protein [Acidimicrobiales bacterium]
MGKFAEVHRDPHLFPRRRCLPMAGGLLAVALVAAACSSGTSSSSATGTKSTSTTMAAASASIGQGTGPVDVLYAGSLVTMMQTSVDAGFHETTGYTITGISAGSTALAEEITGGVHVADVLVSASPKADAALEGPANGTWVTWYATFATSPLLLAYNPSSKFAATFKSKPWWKVITEPGIHVGRTNPVTDPKGALIVKAVDQAAAQEHDTALKSVVASTADVFPEQTLVGRLQAGQLDAGFFYGVEASAAKLPTVPLEGVDLGASYTITVVSHAPHAAAADALVEYFLSARGKTLLERNGLTELHAPKLSGNKSAVPSSLKKVLG